MDQQFKTPPVIRLLALILAGAGILAIVYGFVTDQPRALTGILLSNYYFVSIALGAMFFVSLHHVTDAGWSAMFKRVAEAMVWYVPFAFIVMLVLLAGLKDIYEWAEPGITGRDPLIAHKSPYLNVTFFTVRLVLLFIIWIFLIVLMRRLSLSGETENGAIWHEKSRRLAMAFIFVFAITFTVASFDWVMSIDSHWFSTLFGIRAIVSSLYYAVALLIIIVICLNRAGYLESMSKYHLNDLARYLFRLSIVFGYLWFIQYLIIWYANIPETTFYYVYRVNEPFTFLFYAELVINWVIPFILLMSDDLARKKIVLLPVSILLLVGFYISLYLQIIPGSTGNLRIGFVEAGIFAGFAGVFMYIFTSMLERTPLYVKNDPLLEESINHHL